MFKIFLKQRKLRFPALLRWLISACFLFCINVVTSASPPEYQIKAVFLYNFALFVEWPRGTFSDSQESIVIGVLGKDPFGHYLDEAVVGERVKGRRLIVTRYRRLADIKECHILFISSSESERLEAILSKLHGRPILTVGDFQGFARRGGMIRFTNLNNKIRLRINLQSTQSANLTISSKLLRPADIVTPGKD